MKSRKVNSVSVEGMGNDDFEDDEELEETVRIWPIMPIPEPVTTSNACVNLSETDDEDEESEVVRALAQLTPNITVSSQKQSQKSRRAAGVKLNIAHLNAIARDVKSGKIALPDIDLMDDAEYEYIWALVDSGAGANVARRNHFPHSRKVKAPEMSLTAANGSDLPNRGAREIVTKDKDGVAVKRIFYDADVEMPIL